MKPCSFRRRFRAGQSGDRPASESEKAWRALQKAIQAPPYPAEWQTNSQPKNKWPIRKTKRILASDAADKLHEFYTKYPSNENVVEARRREYDLLKVAVDWEIRTRNPD